MSMRPTAAAFDKFKNEHIAVYGPDNHLRLTGLHETQSRSRSEGALHDPQRADDAAVLVEV